MARERERQERRGCPSLQINSVRLKAIIREKEGYRRIRGGEMVINREGEGMEGI